MLIHLINTKHMNWMFFTTDAQHAVITFMPSFKNKQKTTRNKIFCLYFLVLGLFLSYTGTIPHN